MLEDATGGMWGLAVAAFVLGTAGGFVLAYLLVLRDKRSRVLEKELEKQKAEFEDHLQKVDEHFVRTSELFQEMTQNYRAVYEHLAAGANELCSDEVVTQRLAQVDDAPLVERKGAGDSAPKGQEAEGRSPQGASGAWEESDEAAPATGSAQEEEAASGGPEHTGETDRTRP